MYIRQIPGRARADGSRLAYLQLARKVRDPQTGKVRDEVLHHFGRADRLDRAQIHRLIDSLARFLGPEERAAARAELGGLGAGLVVERSLSLGGPHVLDAVWRRLGLDRALAELPAERAYEHDVERLLFALVASRALAPRSKLALERWVGRKVAIDGLPAVAVHSLYRAMDFLVEHGEALQRAVFSATASLLNLAVDLLFLDTTSAYVEADEEDDNGLRRFGHSRDHRPDRPQVVVALAVTRAGIPVRCWVLPGNTADAAVVEGVQRDLAGWRLNRVVWVMDRGMAGRSQRAALQRGGGHVVVGEKLRAGGKEAEAALGRPGRYRRVRDNLEVKEVTLARGSEERRFVLVRNPGQAVRDREKRAALLERLAAELDRLNAGRRGPGHGKAVCALKSHPAYGRFVDELADGTLRLDRARLRAEERLDGKYLLSTTDPSLSAEEVALGYKQLAEVDARVPHPQARARPAPAPPPPRPAHPRPCAAVLARPAAGAGDRDRDRGELGAGARGARGARPGHPQGQSWRPRGRHRPHSRPAQPLDDAQHSAAACGPHGHPSRRPGVDTSARRTCC